MNFFHRNQAGSGHSGNGHKESDEPVSHRLTLDLSRADEFAAMVANSRASRVDRGIRFAGRDVHLQLGAAVALLGG